MKHKRLRKKHEKKCSVYLKATRINEIQIDAVYETMGAKSLRAAAGISDDNLKTNIFKAALMDDDLWIYFMKRRINKI